jgi:phage terminase large subunit-like protein
MSDMVNTRALSHDGDPRLARHLSNAVLKQDSRGTRLQKETKNSSRKIDLAVAAVMALERAMNQAPAEQPQPEVNVYF